MTGEVLTSYNNAQSMIGWKLKDTDITTKGIWNPYQSVKLMIELVQAVFPGRGFASPQSI